MCPSTDESLISPLYTNGDLEKRFTFESLHNLWGLAASYLLLATSRAVPDSVSPALVKRGDCNRQRTWYQWVRGSVGAVDSHTVILRRECQLAVRQGNLWRFGAAASVRRTYTDPMNATSNQKARPCTRPEFIIRNLKGISILRTTGGRGGNVQCDVDGGLVRPHQSPAASTNL